MFILSIYQVAFSADDPISVGIFGRKINYLSGHVMPNLSPTFLIRKLDVILLEIIAWVFTFCIICLTNNATKQSGFFSENERFSKFLT